LGIEPLRIDLLTSLKGIAFADAWERRAADHCGDIPDFYISKQDLADIDRLIKA